jgi:hydrophobe/amphiphile efflux-1 (HAE1) family protein
VSILTQAIQRPVATSLLTAGVFLLGVLAYTRLPIASLPSVDRPTVVVSAPLPGASPSTVATALAQPLERQIGQIPGIVEMSSYSGTGGTEIAIQFNLGKDIDDAAGAVQSAISAAGPDLPKDRGWPPVYWKSNPAGFAPIVLALTSDVFPTGEVYNYADTLLSPKLSQLSGVARVLVTGAERNAVRVQVLPDRLASMNLSLETVRSALVQASLNLPKGAVSSDNQRYTLVANDQLLKAEDYVDVVVAWRNGAPIRLSDIATVSDSVVNNRLAGWYGTDRGVVLYVYKQPDANVVETVDAVKAMVPQIEHWLPPGIKLSIVYDRTSLIRGAIADVQMTLAIAVGLVVLVIAIFLRRFWATVIPSITIPVSLAATLAIMALCGFSLDNLSLMALTIAAGFVVDDAIIVIENIQRRMAGGETAIAAAIAGSRQMGFTIVSITVALVAALTPVLFMPDVVGRYFREFGVTLVAAVVASAVVSLTLTPMMCGQLLGDRDRSHAPEHLGRISAFYQWSLDWFLLHRVFTISVTVAVTGATIGLYLILPKGFMPTQDTGVMYVRTIAPPSISFASMEGRQREVGTAILQDEAVSGLVSYIGEGNGGALSIGTLIVALKPLEQRLPISQVIARLREKMAGIDGVRVLFVPMQDLNLGAQSGSARYQYTLWGIDGDQVARAGDNMLRRFRTLPQVRDIVQSWETSGLQAGITIDRLRAAALGVTPVAIDNTLNDAFGQRQINLVYFPSNFARVIFEIDQTAAVDPSILNELYVRGNGGRAVPLSAMTRPKRAHAPMWLRHYGQFPAVTISFDTGAGATIGDAVKAIRAAEADAGLPDEVRAEFRGEAAETEKSGGQQGLLYIGAIIAIYIVLGVLYESFVHPLTILSVLPSTIFGALLALWAAGITFTLVTSIACILLVGIVMKNAIMMVDFALALERSQQLDATEAIRLAAQQRLRPIVMTMFAAILSAVPLAIGRGPGFELRQPLGVAIVGGLLMAQLFTLYTTPVVFVMIDKLRRKAGSSRHRQMSLMTDGKRG